MKRGYKSIVRIGMTLVAALLMVGVMTIAAFADDYTPDIYDGNGNHYVHGQEIHFQESIDVYITLTGDSTVYPMYSRNTSEYFVAYYGGPITLTEYTYFQVYNIINYGYPGKEIWDYAAFMTFIRDYQLTMVNGTYSYNGEQLNSGYVPPEVNVDIKADPAPAGKKFKEWVIENPDGSYTNTYEETTIKMGEGDTTVTAVYEDDSSAHVHDFTGEWLKDEEGHWHKCPDDDATDGKAHHIYADDAATECDECGYERIVAPPEPIVYTIIVGNGQTVTKGNEAVFVSDAPFDKFAKVRVDGADVNPSNYSVAAGSTEVTFTADYISGLSEGSHTLAIVASDGEAKGEFTVAAATNEDDNDDGEVDDADENIDDDYIDDVDDSEDDDDSNSSTSSDAPKTGDEGNVLNWVMLLLLASGSLVTGLLARKRR